VAPGRYCRSPSSATRPRRSSDPCRRCAIWWPSFLSRERAVLAPAAAALLVYLPALGNPFVYDDSINIVKNASIRQLSNLPRFFTRAETATSNESYVVVYRPLSTVSYAVDYALGRLRPRGYIAHNVLLHALAAALCAAAWRALTGSAWLAAAGGLVFALHPVQTEPVNWATGRATLLFTVFYLLTVWLYARAGRRGARAAGLWLLSYAAAAGALLSKEMAVTLPAALLLVEWLLPPDPGRAWRSRLLRIAPYAGLTVAYLVLRASIVGHGAVRAEYWGGSPWKTLQAMGKVMARYAQLLALPVGQNVEHVVPIPERAFDLPSLVGFAAVAGIAFAAWALRRRQPVIAFGLFWIGVVLAPVSNIIPFYGLIAERHLYVATAGFGLALGGALQWGAGRRAAALVMLICALYTGGTLLRSRVWSDEALLWEDVVAKSPSKLKAHTNLGLTYLRRERFDDAVAQLHKALAIYPRSAGAHAGLGLAYLSRNDLERGVAELRLALDTNPRHLDALKHLAGAYVRMGRLQEAEETARRGLDIRDDPDIRYVLSAALTKQNRLPEAEAELSRILAFDAGHSDALRQMGILRHRQGNPAEALGYYRRALRSDPSPDLLYNIALLEMEQGEYAAAAAGFTRARALAPQVPEIALRQAQAEIHRDLRGRVSPEALGALKLDDLRGHAAAARLLRLLPDAAGIAARLEPALALRSSREARQAILAALAGLERGRGRVAEARRWYESILQAGGDEAACRLAIGEMAAQAGDHAGAERELERALALDPGLAQAQARLGFIARTRGDAAAALARYTRALQAEPRMEAALDGRCEALFELERRDAARACFEERVRARPDHPQAHYYLGQLYRRAGDAERARSEFALHETIRARRSGERGDTAASIE
jgi:tetratricopeptide (TPR) repeat protein